MLYQLFVMPLFIKEIFAITKYFFHKLFLFLSSQSLSNDCKSLHSKILLQIGCVDVSASPLQQISNGNNRIFNKHFLSQSVFGQASQYVPKIFPNIFRVLNQWHSLLQDLNCLICINFSHLKLYKSVSESF